jgi:hypothetical protein
VCSSDLILIAGQSVDFPDYLTISTEFGGGAEGK